MPLSYPHYLRHIRLVSPAKIGKPMEESPNATGDLETHRDAQDRLVLIERTSESTVSIYRQRQNKDGTPADAMDRLQVLNWGSLAGAELWDKTPVPLSHFDPPVPVIPTKAEAIAQKAAAAAKAEADDRAKGAAEKAAQEAAQKTIIAEAETARAAALETAKAAQEARAKAAAAPPTTAKAK